MRVVVVGAGEVGSFVAERLSREGHDVAVVERDRGRLRQLEDTLDVLAVAGEGTSPAALQRAGLARADLLVAVTSSDDTNLVACLLAAQAGVARRVARIESAELRGPQARRLHEAVGADLVLDPDLEAAEEILDLLELPGATDVADLAGGEVLVVGARLAAGAPVVGRTLSELAAEREPEWDLLFGAVGREGRTIIPRGDLRLEAGDLVRVLCTRRARADLARLLGLQRSAARRVMVLGGGRTGEHLARRLEQRGASVVVVEHDAARAEELAERLPRTLVLQGDVTDADLLAEEQVEQADAVVALTGEDDANVLACLYARSVGVPETVAMVHRLTFLPLLAQAGIHALTSRTAFANAVLRSVRGDVAAVATFLEGEAEVLELEVRQGSAADGAAIAGLGLPGDVLIGAVVRDGKARIGRGRTVLRARDHVVVFARVEAVPAVRRAFE
ncbi:MAG: Trk system potassium transporter TrkA [Acidimicrobiales bacterium]|nr:Trk system potassium transporter TrkA [Acidimicrobiales bacterium]